MKKGFVLISFCSLAILSLPKATPLEAFTLQSNTPIVQVIAKPVAIAAGGYHTCALMSDKSVKCWGWDSHGQIGDGGAIVFNSNKPPTKVAGLSGVKSLAGGYAHTCALLDGGTVTCWGDNSDGQSGSGSSNPSQSSSPQAVPGLASVSFLAAGYNTTCAVTEAGATYCWGQDDRTTSVAGINYDFSPTKIDGAGQAQAVSPGSSHTCVLKQDGTVKCWGWDGSGQVGDGGDIDVHEFQETPTTIGGLDDVVSIALGEQHSCAVIADGTARCWGDSNYEELGESHVTDRSSPIHVEGGLDDVVKMGAGRFHTCALISTGKVYCWGSGTSGQVGPNISATPVEVPNLGFAKDIAVGEQHTCALSQNILTHTSTVKCWGNNGYGQLGDGTTTNQYSPVSVKF